MTPLSGKNKVVELIKKSVDIGLEAVHNTRDKIESLVDELVEQGQVSLEQKAGLVKEITEKIEKKEKDLYHKMIKEVKDAIQEIGCATREDMEKLQQMISEKTKHKSSDE